MPGNSRGVPVEEVLPQSFFATRTPVGWAAQRGPSFNLHEIGPFPGSLPPNRTGAFQRIRLSSDLCRVRDWGHVDVLMTGGADDKGFAPHSRHEGCPRGLAWSGLAEISECGDLMDSHRLSLLA